MSGGGFNFGGSPPKHGFGFGAAPTTSSGTIMNFSKPTTFAMAVPPTKDKPPTKDITQKPGTMLSGLPSTEANKPPTSSLNFSKPTMFAMAVPPTKDKPPTKYITQKPGTMLSGLLSTEANKPPTSSLIFSKPTTFAMALPPTKDKPPTKDITQKPGTMLSGLLSTDTNKPPTSSLNFSKPTTFAMAVPPSKDKPPTKDITQKPGSILSGLQSTTTNTDGTGATTGGGFYFGGPSSQALAPAATGGFNFGSSTAQLAAVAHAPVTGGFNFADLSIPTTSTQTATWAPPYAGGFNFGGGAVAQTSSTGRVADSGKGALTSDNSKAPAIIGGGLGFGSTPQAPAGGFNFGGAQTTGVAPANVAGGFNFGGAQQAMTATGSGGGLCGGMAGLGGGGVSVGVSGMATVAAVEDAITCCICFDVYRDPHALPCLHTLCKPCIDQLVVRGRVECPECREISIVTNVRKDFKTQSLIDAHSGKCGGDSGVGEVCGMCRSQGKVATSHCKECEHFMCVGCEQTHKAIKVCRGHTVRAVKDLVQISQSKLEACVDKWKIENRKIGTKSRNIENSVQSVQDEAKKEIQLTNKHFKKLIHELEIKQSALVNEINEANEATVKSLWNNKECYDQLGREIKSKIKMLQDVITGKHASTMNNMVDDMDESLKEQVIDIRKRVDKLDDQAVLPVKVQIDKNVHSINTGINIIPRMPNHKF